MSEMNEIPTGWTVAKLGEITITQKGKKPKRVSKFKTDECSIPYVNIKAFEKNIIDEYTNGVGCVLCEDDDFLMVWDGSRSGYVGKAIKGALGSTLVRIKLPLMNQDYVYYFLQSKFIEINTRAKGVGIPHVDPNLLWNYDFPIAPLNEQKRILAKLEQLLTDLDKGIEYLETSKQQLKVYRESVLKWAFEGKLTNSVMNREKLGGHSNLITKGASPKWQGFNYIKDSSQLLFITSENVRENYIDVSEPKYLSLDFNGIQKRSILQKEDVLFNLVGASIGRAAIFYLDQISNINQAVAIIRLKKSISNKYLSYYLNAEVAKQNYLDKVVDVARANLSLTDIANMDIPLPTESTDQDRIVKEIESRLSVCDKIEETIESSLQQAEALRLSIIKKAFEGKLVPQDPNDEPAEKLLERIRAAKGNGKPEKKVKAERKPKRKEKIEI